MIDERGEVFGNGVGSVDTSKALAVTFRPIYHYAVRVSRLNPTSFTFALSYTPVPHELHPIYPSSKKHRFGLHAVT